MSEPSQAARWSMGWFDENAIHHFPVSVYYEDTDAGGIVYHANYLRFMERGRSEMLRYLGFEHRVLLAEEGVSFAVRGMTIEFVTPGRLDDRLEVETRITDIGGASFCVAQEVRRDGVLLAEANLKLVVITPAGKAARLPKAVRKVIEELRVRQKRD